MKTCHEQLKKQNLSNCGDMVSNQRDFKIIMQPNAEFGTITAKAIYSENSDKILIGLLEQFQLERPSAFGILVEFNSDRKR